MLEITIDTTELWDESSREFISVSKQTIKLEHSLVSLSKWESKWCKPFLTKDNKTPEETLDYIRCMALDEVKPEVLHCLTSEHIQAIQSYISAPMTATRITNLDKGRIGKEQVTSELVYYWMIALNIPFECQNWHLNRLITLIGVCNVKNQPPKKMSKGEIMRRNAALNAARKAQTNSRG